jgi:hypothetical protein
MLQRLESPQQFSRTSTALPKRKRRIIVGAFGGDMLSHWQTQTKPRRQPVALAAPRGVGIPGRAVRDLE